MIERGQVNVDFNHQKKWWPHEEWIISGQAHGVVDAMGVKSTKVLQIFNKYKKSIDGFRGRLKRTIRKVYL